MAGRVALLGGLEAGGVADDAELAVFVGEGEDERADGALLLAGAPADDDRVDRADALDLGHADALAGLVGRVLALGDHALAVLEPGLGLGGVLGGGGELRPGRRHRASRSRRSRWGSAEQGLVVEARAGRRR